MLKAYLVAITIVILFGVNVFLVVKNSQDDYLSIFSSADQPPTIYGQAYILPIAGPNYIPILDSNISRPEVSAKSAAVFDTKSSRFLYDKNSSFRLPIASLTKIMTAVIAKENFNLDDIVTVYEESIRVDGEKQDLYLGEKISVKNLLKLALIESSNDAAYALAAYSRSRGIDFVGAMNVKAGELGMADSYFTDPAGLDDGA